MDYNKIKKVLKERNIPITMFIKNVVRMTPTGFYQSLENKTLTVKKLEEISVYLNIPMYYWWEEDQEIPKVEEFIVKYKVDHQTEIKRLRKQIDGYVAKEIEYRAEIDRLKAK